jgi:hypothetical protein
MVVAMDNKPYIYSVDELRLLEGIDDWAEAICLHIVHVLTAAKISNLQFFEFCIYFREAVSDMSEWAQEKIWERMRKVSYYFDYRIVDEEIEKILIKLCSKRFIKLSIQEYNNGEKVIYISSINDKIDKEYVYFLMHNMQLDCEINIFPATYYLVNPMFVSIK